MLLHGQTIAKTTMILHMHSIFLVWKRQIVLYTAAECLTCIFIPCVFYFETNLFCHASTKFTLINLLDTMYIKPIKTMTKGNHQRS